jgi:hypothetical protein
VKFKIFRPEICRKFALPTKVLTLRADRFINWAQEIPNQIQEKLAIFHLVRLEVRMKMGLLVIAAFCSTLVVGSQAQARKAPKYKVVAVTFTEKDTRQVKRGPATVDEKAEVDAAARLEARSQYASNQSIPDFD